MIYRIQRCLRRWDYSLISPVDFEIDPELKASHLDVDIPIDMIARYDASIEAYNAVQSELRDMFDKQLNRALGKSTDPGKIAIRLPM